MALTALPPLPQEHDTSATLLAWSSYDETSRAWVDLESATAPSSPPIPASASPGISSAPLLHTSGSTACPESRHSSDDTLTLVTWNVDAFGPGADTRLTALLEAVRDKPGVTRTPVGPLQAPAKAPTTPPPPPRPDIIFLQEVSQAGWASLLANPWVRTDFLVSHDVELCSDSSPFQCVTLVSRSRFFPSPSSSSPSSSSSLSSPPPSSASPPPRLGPVWRLDLPSRYGRYGLCCDLVVGGGRAAAAQGQPCPPSPPAPDRALRLVNVHLDSLAFQPSKRPRQLAIVSRMLHQQAPIRDAGAGLGATATSDAPHGLVAGDFNPVIPAEDDPLVAANGMLDAWPHVHPPTGEPGTEGFTWGIDGKQEYPAARLDKVAMVGLEPLAITIVHPDQVDIPDPDADDAGERMLIPWSDHSGLRCTFRLSGLK